MSFVILGAAFLHFPPYADSFLLDDYKQIEFIRPLAETPWRAYRVLSPFWLGWYYRPVQNVLILANYLAYGTNSFGYYLTVFGLHAVNIALLYQLARLWGARRLGAVAATVLFAFHFLHYNVLGWISSVGVAVAAAAGLLSVYAFSRYLITRRRSLFWLVLALFSAVAALLAREETVVILPLLLLTRRLHPTGKRPARAEMAVLAVWLSGLAVYLYYQAVRPTWTEGVDAIALETFFGGLGQLAPLRFLLQVSGQFLLLDIAGEPALSRPQLVAALFLLALCAVWFLKGQPAARLGLLWAAAYLGLLYLLIWSREMEALAPRYLYLPGIGVALALGATVGRVGRRRPVLTILLLVATTFFHYGPVRATQAGFYAHTREVQSIRAQMTALIPDPPSDAHFFAHEILPADDFVQAAATVWYDRVFPPPGGHLGRLFRLGEATDHYYVLNYEDGLVYNLMPSLQQHERTVFIWSDAPPAEIVNERGALTPMDEGAYRPGVVAGPAADRRYGVYVHPPAPEMGWSSLVYQMKPPLGSVLHLAVWKDVGGVALEDGMAFRVRAVNSNGEEETLVSTFIDLKTAETWQEIVVPMESYWGEAVQLRLEVAAGQNLLHDHGYWAVPRLVVDDGREP